MTVAVSRYHSELKSSKRYLIEAFFNAGTEECPSNFIPLPFKLHPSVLDTPNACCFLMQMPAWLLSKKTARVF